MPGAEAKQPEPGDIGQRGTRLCDVVIGHAGGVENDSRRSAVTECGPVEARSKRGVAKATIQFDTKQAGYIASGGTTVTFTGTIADLAAPFTLAGTGPGFTVEFSFTPTSAAAGSLSYTGSGGGATLTGSGTYTITGDDPNLLTLNYNAEGCADVGGCRSTSNAITLTAVT